MRFPRFLLGKKRCTGQLMSSLGCSLQARRPARDVESARAYGRALLIAGTGTGTGWKLEVGTGRLFGGQGIDCRPQAEADQCQAGIDSHKCVQGRESSPKCSTIPTSVPSKKNIGKSGDRHKRCVESVSSQSKERRRRTHKSSHSGRWPRRMCACTRL